MRWKIAAPLTTTAVMLLAVWGGITEEGQNEGLSALLFGVAAILLGVLLTQIVVAWWQDVHRRDEDQ